MDRITRVSTCGDAPVSAIYDVMRNASPTSAGCWLSHHDCRHNLWVTTIFIIGFTYQLDLAVPPKIGAHRPSYVVLLASPVLVIAVVFTE